MISDFLISVIFNVINVAISVFTILPDVSLSADFLNGISGLAPYYSGLALIFPIGALLAVLAFELAYESAVLVYKLIRWAYQKIPFIN